MSRRFWLSGVPHMVYRLLQLLLQKVLILFSLDMGEENIICKYAMRPNLILLPGLPLHFFFFVAPPDFFEISMASLKLNPFIAEKCTAISCAEVPLVRI